MNRVNDALGSHEPDNRAFWRDNWSTLADDLPPPMRQAISYAPAPARGYWLGFFALDRRFAQIVANAREPMLAQMRLAWWRETLVRPVEEWPAGELLLEGLRDWAGHRSSLAAMADGWEAMLGEVPLGAAALAALAGARGDAIAAIARLSGHDELTEDAYARGYRWASADIALHLSDDTEKERALALWRGAPRCEGRAPRVLRPVAVMDALARQGLEKGGASGAGAFATALRVGLFGR